MKLAVTMAQKAPENALILLRGSFSESIRIAASLGYKAAELYLSPEETDLSILKNCYLKYGMSISAIGTGGSYVYDRLSLTDPQEEARDQCLARLHEFIELGAALKAAVSIGSAQGSIPGTGNYDHYEHYCLDGLCRLAEHAA
jgi:5-keto-L-gluconate epimerase